MMLALLIDIQEIFGDEFDALMRKLMSEWEVPGMNIAIIPDIATPLCKSYGTSIKNQPFTSETRFPICSLTKHITALTLLKPLDERGLSIDTPVGDILPLFKLKMEGKKRVTMRHIISLGAGIEVPNAIYTDPAAQEDMVSYLSELPCTAEPGTTSIHSNMMFDIAALVIEELDINGRKFEVILKEDIFDPLGMSQTSFEGQAEEEVAMGLCPLLIDGELLQGEGIEVGTGPNQGIQSLKSETMGKGSFGIISTPHDMSKWVQSLQYNPYFKTPGPGTMRDDPTWPGVSLLDGPSFCRYGLFEAAHAGVSFLETYGATAGYRSNMAMIPEFGISIIVMANSEEAHHLGALVKYWAIRKVLGVPFDEVMIAIGKERKEHHQSKKIIPSFSSSPLPDNRPIGRYIGPGLGTWIFTPNTYVEERPELRNIPDMPWVYGPCKAKLMSIGQNRYDGWMEWTDGDTVYHGCQYQLKVIEGGIEITGGDFGSKEGMCILRRSID